MINCDITCDEGKCPDLYNCIIETNICVHKNLYPITT